MSGQPPPFRILGHRGAAALAPENTVPSFATALAEGADGLETDVHATRDGHLVCSHDRDGRRMADRPVAVAEATLAEVQGWDAGWGFTTPAGERPFAGEGLTVPTLEEVLERFPGVPVSVDLKPRDVRLAEKLVALLRRLDAEARVTVGSFHGRVVHAVRRLRYAGPTALTPGELRLLRLLPLPLGMLRRFVGGHAAMIPRRASGLALDGPRFVRRLRALGKRVDFWVVNDADVAAMLVSRGATGLVSDDPAAVRRRVVAEAH